MKQILTTVFLFITIFAFGNSIDSIQNDNDVLTFLKKIEKRFSGDKYRQLQIFPTTDLRQKLTCDLITEKCDIQNWEKADFNGDGKTDLIVTAYWYDFDVFVAIDKGDNSFQLIQLSRDPFLNCELGKPIQINSEQALLFYRIRDEFDETITSIFDSKLKSRTDTLIYKLGGFIEKNRSPASYEIAEIQYQTVSGWTGFSAVHTLQFSESGKVTFEAKSDRIKEAVPKRDISMESIKPIVELIQYIAIKQLRNKYRVSWTDDTTMFLKIRFTDGTIKEIEDYGMNGTFGLYHLYELLMLLKVKRG